MCVLVLPQMLCVMFKLQVIMLSWDRKEAEAAVGAAAALLQQLEQPGTAASPAFVALLKLQFTMLQVWDLRQLDSMVDTCILTV
jgi:hypothetical protein